VPRCLIHNLKFRGVRDAAKPLAELVAKYLTSIPVDLNDFLLIPIPLSRLRRNERGFNQTEEIARHLTRLVPLRTRTDILTRTRHTKPQTETADVAERRRNVLSCFSVAKPDAIAQKDILLLDDVATSGATLGEAARALKGAGARRIIGVTAAKA
jgi:ComF family protein